tara:strand:- start:9 stop:407 length:399 start_codon:yes stop_codon:yes gene_type:complete
MPVYKALILNKEINVNYEYDQREKLEEAIEAINDQLKNYDNLNGKISDSKLLSFLAIKLQAEILEFNTKKNIEVNLEKKFKNSKNDNINLNDKLQELRKKNKRLEIENYQINKDIIQLQNQINIIIKLIKNL